MWKAAVKTIKKGKIFNISILASTLHTKKEVLQSLISTCTIHCKSHDFLISCFESGHIFQKMWLFGKINFVIPFWTKSITVKNVSAMNKKYLILDMLITLLKATCLQQRSVPYSQAENLWRIFKDLQTSLTFFKNLRSLNTFVSSLKDFAKLFDIFVLDNQV